MKAKILAWAKRRSWTFYLSMVCVGVVIEPLSGWHYWLALISIDIWLFVAFRLGVRRAARLSEEDAEEFAKKLETDVDRFQHPECIACSAIRQANDQKGDTWLRMNVHEAIGFAVLIGSCETVQAMQTQTGLSLCPTHGPIVASMLHNAGIHHMCETVKAPKPKSLN